MSSMCQLCYGSGEVMRKHTALHGRSYFGQAMCTKGLSIITHHVILGCRQAGISGVLSDVRRQWCACSAVVHELWWARPCPLQTLAQSPHSPRHAFIFPADLKSALAAHTLRVYPPIFCCLQV